MFSLLILFYCVPVTCSWGLKWLPSAPAVGSVWDLQRALFIFPVSLVICLPRMRSTLLPIPSDSVTEECWTDTIIHTVEVLPDLGVELDLKGRRMERKGMFVFFSGESLPVVLYRTVSNLLLRQGGPWVQASCSNVSMQCSGLLSQARSSLLLWGKASWE